MPGTSEKSRFCGLCYSRTSFRGFKCTASGKVAHGEIGTLALDESQSPLMWFKGYDGDDRKSFVGQYYLTGDTVRLNEFGGIDFIGRADDVITTSGYRVGPFDVESTLLECEEVLESAVIGKPDPESVQKW